MIAEKADIVVVGAGPAGLIAARESAKGGANVLVLEEHEEIGLPSHCAGLLSLKGLSEIGVPSDGSFIQNKVKGARFYSPSKRSFTVERDEPVACVIDRTIFDKLLGEQAVKAGAKIRLGFKVQKIERLKGNLTVKGDRGEAKAKIVIDGEGVVSRFVKMMGLQPLPSEDLLPALQYDLTDVDVNPDYVEIHTSRKIAPNFFAWVIPLNKNCVRTGLACKGANPQVSLEKFLKDRFGDESKLHRIYTRSGLIVTSGPISKTFDDNFIVTGDAAGQVKPTTGGGVILGGICAAIAGKVTAEAIKEGSADHNFLSNYETLWRKKLGREFRLTRLVRKTANKLSDETVDRIFKSIIDSNLQDELSVFGDMDFQANSLLRVLRKPDLLKILFSSITEIIK